jgi:predicted alpha/beta-fold hydrolase
LFRSFAVGFALGALAICLFLATQGGNPVVASAIAAPVPRGIG